MCKRFLDKLKILIIEDRSSKTAVHNTLISLFYSISCAIQLLYCTNQLLFNSSHSLSLALSFSLSTFLEYSIRKQVTIGVEYLCPICTEPLTEPYLSIECGHHHCRQCRDRLLSIGKTECPTCREPDVLMNAVLDKHLQRLVRSVKVRCSYYQEGCEWVGELRDLHDHLDPAMGGCSGSIACPFGCGKYGRRSEMRDHTCACKFMMIDCLTCMMQTCSLMPASS